MARSLAVMSNCQAGPHVPSPANDVSPSETHVSVSSWRCASRLDALQLPDRERWPETRRALVLWMQEHLDRELDKLPRKDWFTQALASHLKSEQRP